jgi:hypothetical protein
MQSGIWPILRLSSIGRPLNVQGQVGELIMISSFIAFERISKNSNAVSKLREMAVCHNPTPFIKSLSLPLSSKGLANIPRQEGRNNFDFIVGEDHYECPWYVAVFLSPKLCRFQTSDGSLNRFIVTTPDPKHQFCDVISLG